MSLIETFNSVKTLAGCFCQEEIGLVTHTLLHILTDDCGVEIVDSLYDTHCREKFAREYEDLQFLHKGEKTSICTNIALLESIIQTDEFQQASRGLPDLLILCIFADSLVNDENGFIKELVLANDEDLAVGHAMEWNMCSESIITEIFRDLKKAHTDFNVFLYNNWDYEISTRVLVLQNTTDI
jgi:hypothetical protein